MPVVRRQDDESIEELLRRFRRAVGLGYERRWYKRRLGYFEKPSALLRKRRKHQVNGEHLHLRIDQKTVFENPGPTNAAGR